MTRRADTKIGRLRAALLDLLAEHRADGTLPTNGQFLWYELEQRGVVDKTKRRGHPGVKRGQDQDLSDALTSLREDGLIPWDWIVDETRQVDRAPAADTVHGWITAAVDEARIDPWDDRPPLIITESRSLKGVLADVAYRYAAPIASTNGQAGGFLRNEIAPLLPSCGPVIYLGDYDLAGNHIEANTRRVLEECAGSLEWERLAITREQVDRYRPPVITKRDQRYRDHRPHEAVETEALSQGVLTGMLTARLDALLPEPLEDVQEREAEQREAVRGWLERMA